MQKSKLNVLVEKLLARVLMMILDYQVWLWDFQCVSASAQKCHKTGIHVLVDGAVVATAVVITVVAVVETRVVVAISMV